MASASNGTVRTVMQIVLQLGPFVHLVLACVATVAILRKRNELSGGTIVATLVVAWVILFVGPIAGLVGLRRSRAVPK